MRVSAYDVQVQGAGVLELDNGATLTADVVNSGTLRPGGTRVAGGTIAGNYTQTATGTLEQVRFSQRGVVVAEHARCWAKAQVTFEPLHYLALLERKPGALDHAKPLAGVLLVTFAVTMLSTGAIGVAIERLSLRPLRGVKGPAAMITTIGISYILFNVILLSCGAEAKNYPNPMPTVRFNIGGAVLDLRVVLIWIVAIVLMGGLYLFVQKSRIGKAMRATAANRTLARNCGIRTGQVITTTWALTGALCGLAGTVFAIDAGSFDATSTDVFLVLILAAVFLGGPGQPYGAMLGALVIGLAAEISAAFIPADYKYVIGFAALLIMLGVRPTGLLGERL